jgi:hypothetical protein
LGKCVGTGFFGCRRKRDLRCGMLITAAADDDADDTGKEPEPEPELPGDAASNAGDMLLGYVDDATDVLNVVSTNERRVKDDETVWERHVVSSFLYGSFL